MEEENSIIIDGFTFSILSVDMTLISGRGKIYIKSCNNSTKECVTFYVYSSLSECGFWRLCLGGKQLHKGNEDYVSQTFIHLELQNFINNFVKKYKKYQTAAYKFNYRRIFETKKSKDKCLYDSQGHGKFQLFSSDKKYDDISSHIDDEIRIEKVYPFYKFSKIIKCGDDRTVDDDFSSELITEKTLKYETPTKEFDFEKNVNLKDNTIATIKGKIMKTQLSINPDLNIEKEEDFSYDPVFLYYLNFDLVVLQYDDEEIINIKDQFAPVILTSSNPDKSKITKYGLYSKYIPAGLYICKIFEYDLQCWRMNNTTSCGRTYSYIGNIYQDLFPYKQIKQQMMLNNKNDTTNGANDNNNNVKTGSEVVESEDKNGANDNNNNVKIGSEFVESEDKNGEIMVGGTKKTKRTKKTKKTKKNKKLDAKFRDVLSSFAKSNRGGTRKRKQLIRT
jgi:hypothetical protein